MDDARTLSCAGKVGFVSRTLAKRAAGRKDTRAPYRCRFCQLWHVGNDVRSAHKRRRPHDHQHDLLP
jgi:hypothetical protein